MSANESEKNEKRKTPAAKLVLAAATTVRVAATMIAVSAAPASAANIRSGAPIMSQPTPYSQHLGGPIGNMPFTMRCWVSTVKVNGTAKWFFGNAAHNHRTGRPNMMYGYVNASYIYNQNTVPHC